MQKSYRIAIVGAHRRRQGTGPYIAAAFHRLGHEISGIIGTSKQSVEESQHRLHKDYHIRASGYTSLAALLEQQAADILVIASPYETHLQYLKQGADAGCHVFCEKPLWFPPPHCTSSGPDEIITATRELLASFDAAGLCIAVNTQWPFTLASYARLYPGLPNAGDVSSFEMHLSPVARDRMMLLDSAPHLVSMLHALVGRGEIGNLDEQWTDAGGGVVIRFDYRHPGGAASVTFQLERHEQQPRPAGYSINGKPVERRISMQDYVLSLASPDNSIVMQDPLQQSVEQFLERLKKRAPNPCENLVHGIRLLHTIVNNAPWS